MNNNGLTNRFLSVDSTNFYQQRVFPSYPNAAVNRPAGPGLVHAARCPEAVCDQSEIAAFSPSFKTPRVQPGSLSLERELVHGVTGRLSDPYVSGWI
jgi:hypothetical protein